MATATRSNRSTVSKNLSFEEQEVQRLGFDYEIVDVPLDRIDIDASSYSNQRLTRLHEDVAETYAVKMTNGTVFPPVVLHEENKRFFIDAGVHRTFARTLTNFKTISAIVLKNVDLSDPATLAKLDVLRVRTNDVHGLGYDLAERKVIACGRVVQGQSVADVAREMSLDPKMLQAVYDEYRVDLELAANGLTPANFPRFSDKKAVLQKGLQVSDMREVERIIVRYSGDDVKRKITAVEVKDLCHALSNARTTQDKNVVFEAARANLAAKQKIKANGSKKTAKAGTSSPKWYLSTALGNIKILDSKAFVKNPTLTDADAEATMDDIYAAMLKLAGLHDALASRLGTPRVTLNR